jgi:hypothetical protein
MKCKTLACALLGLGMTAMAPVCAHADDWRRDRDYEYRHDDWRRDDWRERDEWRRREAIRHEHWAEPIDMREVPERVRDRVNDYRHNRHIESIRLVHDHGEHYYSFRINGPRYGDFYLDIAPDGHVIRRINL